MNQKSLIRQRKSEIYYGFCSRPGSRYEPLPKPSQKEIDIEPKESKQATK